MINKIIFVVLTLALLVMGTVVFWPKGSGNIVINNPIDTLLNTPTIPITTTPFVTPTPALVPPPTSKILAGNYHVFQSFNNCGPAALSMALYYYGITVSQQELGQALRPYQNPQGDNDDKSVTLEELADKAREYNLTPYHRPNGNMEIVKYAIAQDIPVITRTLLTSSEDIGHYRVIKGYDDTLSEIIQDDSLQGANLRYSYDQLDLLWKQFNYEYLLLVPSNKIEIIEQVLGADVDPKVAWGKAVDRSRDQLGQNPSDVYARFNLSVALYNIGDYQGSVDEFEKVEKLLSFRTLWYQIEPIEAYFALGNYGRVFSLTDSILNNYNRAFSELYILRGKIYEAQGNDEAAQMEFDKAILYNRNIKI